MISIIVVIGKNKAIGCNNKLLWNIPEDMARFKKITTGHPIIMGRKTFDSIGQALPKRSNVIITRDKKYQSENCFVTNSLSEALDIAKKSIGSEEVFVIGGGQIYERALPYADKLYVTVVDDEPEADTFFPDYSAFSKVIKKEEGKNEKFKYTFFELIKK